MNKKTLTLILILLFSSFHTIGSVPDFSLKKLNGEEFNIGDHIGKKVILIDFWATWCKPCKKLLKKISILQENFQKDLLVLAISTDDTSAFSRIENFVKSKNYKFTVLLDPDSSVSSLFNPSSKIPFTMIIDRKGEIRYTHTGYIPGFEKELKKLIKRLSDEQK